MDKELEKETPTNQEEFSEDISLEEEESGEPTPTKADEGEESSSEEDIEQLKKKLKEYKARMEHHKKKQRELEAKLKELESKKSEKKISSSETSVFDLAKKVLKLKDYSPAEIEFIETVARGKGIPPEEAVDLPEVKEFIMYQREKVAKEQRTPEPSTRTSPSKKSFEEITPEDLSKMSLEEKEKYFKWWESQGKFNVK